MSTGEWVALGVCTGVIVLVLLFPNLIGLVVDRAKALLFGRASTQADAREQILKDAAQVVEDQARDGMTTLLAFRESLRHHRSVRATEHLFTREGWSQ